MRVLLAGRCDRKADTYVCQANYHVRRRRGELEELVVKTVLGILARPDAVGLLTRDDDEATRAHEQAEALRARLDLAADAYAAGRIDTRQLTRITAQLSPQIEALQQVVRAASSAPDLFDLARPDITERWDELPLARQRAVIAALLEVRVLPARIKGGAERFDPRDVEIPPRRPS